MTIDYRSIPELQKALNKLEGIHQSEDNMIACFGRTLLWLADRLRELEY